MSERLKQSLEARRRVEEQISTVLEEDYPPGAPIIWRSHGGQHYGKVVRLCYGDRLEVENERSGKRRFIYATSIVT